MCESRVSVLEGYSRGFGNPQAALKEGENDFVFTKPPLGTVWG